MTGEFCDGCHVPEMLEELSEIVPDLASRMKEAYVSVIPDVTNRQPGIWKDSGDIDYASCCVTEYKGPEETGLDVVANTEDKLREKLKDMEAASRHDPERLANLRRAGRVLAHLGSGLAEPKT